MDDLITPAPINPEPAAVWRRRGPSISLACMAFRFKLNDDACVPTQHDVVGIPSSRLLPTALPEVRLLFARALPELCMF